ncbi:MAG: hypothetical protein ABSH37_23515, partial [Bryobacteraceae bacterium]
MIAGTGFKVGQALPPANSRFIEVKKCRDNSRHSRLDSPGWCTGKLRHGGCGVAFALLALLLPWAAIASSTTAWEMGSWSDFIRGRFQGVSLSREGRLSLAPKVETVFTSDQPVIWAVAEAPDGTLYAATGNRGR